MDDCERSDSAHRISRIRQLNDRLRCQKIGGRIMLTRGVNALPHDIIHRALAAIQVFNAFTPSNDPHGEQDFGQVLVDGHAIIWKIDCYDIDLQWASPDASDETITCRVMTIMLAEEL